VWINDVDETVWKILFDCPLEIVKDSNKNLRRKRSFSKKRSELLKKYSVKEVMEVLDQIEAMGTRVKRLCPYSCEICEQEW